MSHPSERTGAAEAFRRDVRRLVDWCRGPGGRLLRCDDDREIRRIVRDGYLRALDLAVPYPLDAGGGATTTALATCVFCRTSRMHRLDPDDFDVQERYREVVARSLDEAIGGSDG